MNVRRLLVLWLLCGSILSQCTEGQNRTTRLAGEVARGLTFRKDIGHGLELVLTPISDKVPQELSGWHIVVSPQNLTGNDECRDLVWVVTPPYRFWNPRYLSTEYGKTAQEAVGISPRDFNFVLNCDDFKTERQRVERVLWPYNYSKEEADDALSKIGTSPHGTGRLWIKDSKFTPGETSVDGMKLGAIHWIKFEIELNFPHESGKGHAP